MSSLNMGARLPTLFFLILIASASLVFAEDTFYPLPSSERPFDLKYFLAHAFTTQTVVNGATCSTYPDKSGYAPYLESKLVLCPPTINGETNKGCSVDIWFGYYSQYLKQYHLNPNQVISVGVDIGKNGCIAGTLKDEVATCGPSNTYELYACANTKVLCGAETFGTQCGQDECSDSQILVTRTCDPHTGSWERTCVARDACATNPTLPVSPADKDNTSPPQPAEPTNYTSYLIYAVIIIVLAAIGGTLLKKRR